MFRFKLCYFRNLDWESIYQGCLETRSMDFCFCGGFQGSWSSCGLKRLMKEFCCLNRLFDGCDLINGSSSWHQRLQTISTQRTQHLILLHLHIPFHLLFYLHATIWPDHWNVTFYLAQTLVTSFHSCLFLSISSCVTMEGSQPNLHLLSQWCFNDLWSERCYRVHH